MSLEAIRARNHQFPFEDITFLIGEVDRLQSGLTLKNLESKWLADGSVPKGAKLLEAWLRNGERWGAHSGTSFTEQHWRRRHD